MGRPNKSEEKRAQILDAFERVILRDGYAKASQRRIAEEAEVNQPMIHHYFSGSEELLEAMLNRVVERYQNALQAFLLNSVAVDLSDVIAFICSKEFHKISMQNEVFFCLIGQGGHNDLTFSKISLVYKEFITAITSFLTQANIKNPEQAAYVIMCLVIGHDWAKKLGFGENRNQLMENTMKNLLES